MLTRFAISILFLGLFMKAYSQTTLIGKWRRVNPNLTHQDTAYKRLKFGDIEIRSDSTFQIEGDSTIQNSVIPGWHVGGEYNGTWELHSGSHLIFWLAPKETKLFVTYRIFKLIKEKLVLRTPSYSRDKRFDITYLRL